MKKKQLSLEEAAVFSKEKTYSWEMAEAGQASAQVPQSAHLSGSI
jgi:hypothetical protein